MKAQPTLTISRSYNKHIVVAETPLLISYAVQVPMSINLGRVKLPRQNILTHNLPVIVYPLGRRMKRHPNYNPSPLLLVVKFHL